MRTFRTDDGVFKVEATVTDRLTIGHPCCSTFACPTSLGSNRHRFCPLHSHLHLQCAIVGCSSPVVKCSGNVGGKVVSRHMKTCADPIHHEMERLNTEQSKANFQLSQKLMRQKVTHPTDAMAEKRLVDLIDLEDAEEWFEVDPVDGQVQMFSMNNPGATGELDPSVPQASCPSKLATGNQKIKAQFGRRRTHNEQVIVRPCGIICSRATFFGAEAVSNVLVSLLLPLNGLTVTKTINPQHMVKKTFSVPGARKPEHLIYNSNCNALKEVESRHDTWFIGVGMCVDAFHLRTKHKASDKFCRT
jgi:hypothetical protein